MTSKHDMHKRCTMTAVTHLPIEPHQWTDNNGNVLVLTTAATIRCKQPRLGSIVACRDWDATPCDGDGLRGWPLGFGVADIDLATDVWLVLEADPNDVVGNIDGLAKCKCRRARISYIGHLAGAIDCLRPELRRYVEYHQSLGKDLCSTAHIAAICAASASVDIDGAYLAVRGYQSRVAVSGRRARCVMVGERSACVCVAPAARVLANGNEHTLVAADSHSTLVSRGDNCAAVAMRQRSTVAMTGDDAVAIAIGAHCHVSTDGHGCLTIALDDASTIATGASGVVIAARKRDGAWDVCVRTVGVDLAPHTRHRVADIFKKQ